MRFQCPRCEAWQDASDQALGGRGGSEQTCSSCGALVRLERRPREDAPTEPPALEPIWVPEDRRAVEAALGARADDTLRELLGEAGTRDAAGRAERLTSSHAQIVAFITAMSPRLWAPASAILATGLVGAVGLEAVAQRIAPALSLLLLPVALGGAAWASTLAATAVAQVVHLRLAGTPIGMGRSVRLLFEHGSGAAGAALRVSLLGAAGASFCLAVALLGVAPGLGGGSGLALTGALLWLQLGAVLLALVILLGTGMVLLLHPGLAGLRDVDGSTLFRFLIHELRHEGRVLLGRASRALGGAVLLVAGFAVLLGLSLRLVSALNGRLLGSGWQDLIGASPLRVIFGAPELLDPPAALSWGGLGMLLSAVGVAAVPLGFVSAYLGVSGYMLGHALHLEHRVRAFGSGGADSLHRD